MAEVARIDFESVERPFITVNMGGDERTLPLTLNDADMALVGGADDQVRGIKAFVAKYLGDVTYELGDDQLGAILRVWGEQRKLLGAPEMGESSASPK